MSNIGDFIKRKREEKKLTVKQICDKTAIRAQYINLLEAGEFDSLPSYVHAHGFLEQYCKVVGLDFYNEVKPLFEQECNKSTFGKTPEEIAMEQAEMEEAGKRTRFVTLASVILVLLLVSAGLLTYSSLRQRYALSAFNESQPKVVLPVDLAASNEAGDKIGDDIPVAIDGNIADDIDIPIESLPVEQLSAAEDTSSDLLLPQATQNVSVRRSAELTFTDDCWVKLTYDNGAVEDFMAIPGMRKSINFSKYFSMDIGNAWAVSVKYRDKLFSGFGGRDRPVKNLYFVVDDNEVMVQQRTPPVIR